MGLGIGFRLTRIEAPCQHRQRGHHPTCICFSLPKYDYITMILYNTDVLSRNKILEKKYVIFHPFIMIVQ